MKEQSGNFSARFSALNTKRLSSLGWSWLSYRLLRAARLGVLALTLVAVTVCYPSSRTVRIAWVHAHSVHRHGLHVQEWNTLGSGLGS